MVPFSVEGTTRERATLHYDNGLLYQLSPHFCQSNRIICCVRQKSGAFPVSGVRRSVAPNRAVLKRYLHTFACPRGATPLPSLRVLHAHVDCWLNHAHRRWRERVKVTLLTYCQREGRWSTLSSLTDSPWSQGCARS